ncbi:hypothetical protein JTB14_020732 [Gonioctena quinquepunctata]|nr:hypothetical protein JTB14_020732 [Gonioctena quinquepunctata]
MPKGKENKEADLESDSESDNDRGLRVERVGFNAASVICVPMMPVQGRMKLMTSSVSCDPLLTGMRTLPRKKTHYFSKETKYMLLPTELHVAQDTEESDDGENGGESELSSDEEISFSD